MSQKEMVCTLYTKLLKCTGEPLFLTQKLWTVYMG